MAADEQFLNKTNFLPSVLQCRYTGLLAADKDHRYRLFSPLVEEMSGLSAADVVGESAESVFPFLRETAAQTFFDQALQGQSGEFHALPYYIEATGRRGLLDAIYRPLYDSDGNTIKGVLWELRQTPQPQEKTHFPPSTPMSIRIGSVIRMRRNRLRMSQEELAARSGLHRTYITDIERGARNISIKNLEHIAKALGDPLWFLLALAEPEGLGKRV